jgi:hypothetical protein
MVCREMGWSIRFVYQLSTEIRVKVQLSVNTGFKSPHASRVHRFGFGQVLLAPAKHVESLGHTLVILSDARKVAMECCDVAFHDSPDRVMYSDSCAYLVFLVLSSTVLTAS